MKKSFLVLSVILGLSLNTALATEVACVDVQKVVNESKQVQTLKKEQEAKAKEMLKFVEKARKEIAATSDTKKKQSLEEKYNKEFQAKREAIAKNYETKLLAIDKNISSVIDENAKANGYNLVLAKGVVLSGGTDITAEISKALK